MVAKFWYLKRLDLSEALDDEGLEELAALTSMNRFEENTPIYFPGDPSDTVYILKQGQVKISRSTADGKRITLTLIEPGEIFGGLSLIDQKDRETRAEAVAESVICAVPRDPFIDFLAEHPELNFEVTRMMGDRRRAIETKLETLLFRDAPSRLAYILNDLFENHAGSVEGAPTLNVSHRDLAELTGLTRPTTTQLLNELQEEGVVELSRRELTLRDPIALAKRADDGPTQSPSRA